MATATITRTQSYSVFEDVDEQSQLRGSSSSINLEMQRACFPRRQHRRRHSSYHVQQVSFDSSENIQEIIDQFLAEMGRRLDFLEAYGQLKLDHGIERAYATLHQVRESCSHVSDEVIGAGRRRAKIFVDLLDERYQSALAHKETMEQKAREGIRLLDDLLADFEARAYGRTSNLIDATKEVIDDSIAKALLAKANLSAKIERAIARARENGLIHFDDLPDPWRVNPYICRGYRFSETKLDCVRSVLCFSNETVNIWSHLIGFLIILALGVYFYPSSAAFTNSTPSDQIIAFLFLLAAGKCLACSTMWHTMSSISNLPLMERFACVDYTGISLLVATSIMTTEYTAFYCEPVSRWFYMLTTFALGVAGTILPWHPTFNRQDMAWGRVAFYVGLAATGLLPFFQLSYSRGLSWAWFFYAPVGKSLVVYFSGAMLYAAKIPERWLPGAFDYFGGSHNIWHFAVLGGILFHYTAMQQFFSHAFARADAECSVY